ncbi:Ger(x)C family spore germination protein [Pontibacillus salicampi]|uniref:Ger(X)C family spore germination protein n=1 Tax=Pontibacillus salicampi TaxID=1449801 RepID=A0ABV6LLU1_9BACI
MNTRLLLVLSSCCMLVLSGCWDQRQFKSLKIVLAASFDTSEEKNIRATVVIPTVEAGMEGPGQEYIQVVSADGNSTRETRSKIDEMISKQFDGSKIRVIAFGEELAKQGIAPVLDVIYRDPRSNLNAKVIMFNGKGEDMLKIRIDHEPRISGYINGLIDGQISSSQAPKENLQLMRAELLEPGEDFTLPVLTKNSEEDTLQFIGLALFHEDKFSGTILSDDESTLLMLLKGKKGKHARLTKPIAQEKQNRPENYITMAVNKVKRDLEIHTDNPEKIAVDITLDLQTDITESPGMDFVETKKIKQVEKDFGKELEKEYKELTKKLIEANSDVLGIGRRVKAYHNETWEKVKWNEVYPEITFNVNVNIGVEQHGIIN